MLSEPARIFSSRLDDFFHRPAGLDRPGGSLDHPADCGRERLGVEMSHLDLRDQFRAGQCGVERPGKAGRDVDREDLIAVLAEGFVHFGKIARRRQ